MKIVDLDYLAPINAENSIILSGGVAAISSSSSFSEVWPEGAISASRGVALAKGKTIYAETASQVKTLALRIGRHITVGSAKALAYASQ
jgi:hypothetical protein